METINHKPVGICLNHNLNDDLRRSLIFDGKLILESSNHATKELCGHAKTMINDTFFPHHSLNAQENIALAEYASLISKLKTKFTNDDNTKVLIQKTLLSLKIDLDTTYFDVPRLRVVTYDDYLTSGIGYAYKPHRDTWYSSPLSQVNYWIPIFNVFPENTMAIYPEYWTRPIKNSSQDFDYEEWKIIGRKEAIKQIEVDTRKHPVPLEGVDSNGVSIAGGSGDLLIFSGAHLHATVPNTTKTTRFSLDFRTINIEDIEKKIGAPNVDSKAKGTTLSDFIRGSDFTPIQEKHILPLLGMKY